MITCSVCGGAIFAGNESTCYAGPICVQSGYHGPYIAAKAAPTDEYIRRIVREELDKRSQETGDRT